MARLPLPADTLIGSHGDQYRIDTVLGPGGFGITYLARSLRLDRDVAIKEYFPGDFAYREGSTTVRPATRGERDYFEEGKRYFIDEARVLGKFRHDNIVRVMGLIEENNTAYMILEFEEGQSLKHWLQGLGRPPTQEEMDRIFDPILSALEVVHAKGLFHRDIAPDNIIIRPSGAPVLIDFGAARTLVRPHSRTVAAIVKPGYSPPEQFTVDTRFQGAWSDVYALAATMFFAMTGRAPEDASARQIQETFLPVDKHLDARLRSLYRPELVAALNAGLRLRPQDRPQSPAAFRALLRPLGANGIEVPSAPRPIQPHLAQPESAPHPEPGPLTAPNPGVALARDPQSPNASADVEPSRIEAAPASGTDAPLHAIGLVGLAVAILSTIGFILIDGIRHPQGMIPLTAVCAGIVIAGLEQLWSLGRGDEATPPSLARPAAVLSLCLALTWVVSFGVAALVIVGPILALAVAFMLGRNPAWKPFALAFLAALHLIAILVLVSSTVGQLHGLAWPLILSSMGAISIIALISAILSWRQSDLAARSLRA